jgi:DNA end-binding protein Ku
VTIPIKLYNAVSRKTVRFNQLDERTGARIKYQKVSAQDGDEVPAEHIVRGYEFAKGQYVTISDDELEAVTPAAQRTVDIEAFVESADIDPVLYDGAYYVAPADGFEKAYRLLVDSLETDGRVAIARYVRHSKQHLVALRPQDGRLVMSNLVWADEIVAPSEIEEFEGLENVELTDAELNMADQLIESLAADFDPDEYHDTYREELVDLLNRKASGEELVVAETAPADDAKVVDLLAALEASVAAAKAARAEPGADGDADEGSSSRSTSRKQTARKSSPAKKKAAPRKKKATAAKTAQKRKSA